MNFEKLKEMARKYEQKEDWRRAIEVYLQAVREFEAGNDPVPDLSVYNRVGDLYLKANEPGAAVQAYERAADLYGEQGFYNNAIALCGKILRVNPGRIQTYLKLAHLHAKKNVVIEAKKNLLEYLERMNALNQLDDAFKAVKDFADQFPGNKEIRLMLSELLRASSRNEEAREQLEKLASDLEARGDTIGARKTLMRLQALDAEGGPAPAAAAEAPVAKAGPKPRSGDLVFLDTGPEIPRMQPKGPGSRKTRAVTIPPAGRPTEKAKAPEPVAPLEGIELNVPVEPIILPPADALLASGGLDIETSSLADGPIELESVQRISDEAQLEATASGDVAKALGFESSEVEPLDGLDVQPLDGLELDQPPPDVVELISSGSGIEIERITAGQEAVFGDDTVERIEIPEPLDDLPELAADFDDRISANVPEEEGGGIGLELIQPDLMGEDDEPAPIAEDVEPDGVVFLEEGERGAGPSITDLEDRVLDDPEDPEAHRALGEALLAVGESLRGQEELELALAGYETREDWLRAVDLVTELIRLDPNGVRYHQKRVEIAFRTGDRGRLIEAYLELADSLLRVGALDKALSVYRRVSDHDPGNQRALAALDALAPVEEAVGPPIAPEPAAPAASRKTPPPPPAPAPLADVAEEADHAVDAMFETVDQQAPPPARKSRQSVPVAKPKVEAPPPSGDFVDFGAMVMDEEAVKDTRMRVEDEEPTGDEQADFRDMLQQFKRGIDANIDAEDFEAHYDLGVAFKEMGLLDEAISEFQKALRSPQIRLKTSEALGTAFFDKGQFAIAEAILKRAVESLGATDDEQIGLIYWLARSLEAQGKADPAVTNYERVLAVDISFMDVTARMGKLNVARGR